MAASSPESFYGNTTMEESSLVNANGCSPTTTISTIAVQSGNTRIVIALLQSKEWIQLKIQEMQPAMTDIGTNLQEATDLYQQHEKVLEKLQTKQSPVEELLRQADDLISTQKPRGEVYSAMAENLGLAWKDLNAQLEQRRQILEQAVAFFSKEDLFVDSLEILKKSVSDTILPVTVESAMAMLSRIKDERKAVLTNSMRMLSEGQLLLERLCEVGTHSMGDSRPLHMQHAARQTASFVERHMESLQDRWRHLESLWNQKKIQLEQCLSKCQLEVQLSEVESWIRTRGFDYANQRNLGDSLANSEILLHEHHKIEGECKEKQEQCLKLVKSAEDLSRRGNYAAEELRSRAYLLLSDCADLTTSVDQRRQLLIDSVDFFRKAQTAQTKLDQLEIQISTSEMATLSSTVEEIASPVIECGRRILNTVGSKEPGAQGVARKVEELEAKKIKLFDLCKAKESVALERTSAFRKFCEKWDELMKWLSNNGQFFVQRTRDMGTTPTAAKTFVDHHESLQNDMRMKGMEMEALLKTVPNLVRCGGEEAEVVHSKSDTLKQQWSQLRIMLEKRISIAQRYFAFLKLSTKISKEMDELERLVRQAIDSGKQSNFRGIEEKQIALKQDIMQLNNNGKNFLDDARKVDDMYLNMSQPISTVEDILNRLEMRNISISTQWLNYQNELSAIKETELQWEHLVKDSHRVIKCVNELERKMFPVIPQELNRVESILSFLENRMSVLLPQIKSVQGEIDNFLKRSENLNPKDDTHNEGRQMLQQLQNVNQGFQKKLTDYQILVSMMTAYFRNFEELEKLVDMQESQFRVSSLPTELSKVEVLVHDHQNSKPTVMELFKFSYTEAQELVKKINEAEPADAAAKDREKVIGIHDARKKAFEKAWEEHRNRLERHHQLSIFNRDMHLINQQIEDLNNQLSSIRESRGDSLPATLHTSEAFLQFEKTIELLQIRIQEFVSTAERLIRDQRVDSTLVRQEITTMQKKWSTFRTEVTNNRRLIDVAIEYFKTIEEAEEWLKEGSRLLISVARKSSSCSKESDVENLRKEVQDFLNKGKSKQEERMRKISSLSIELYGDRPRESTFMVTNKNKDMIDSFGVITTELNTLSSNIKIAEQTKIVKEKGKEEMNAVLHAAQAEAEAAKAAAAAAQEAAQLAAAAAKAIPPKPQQKPPRFIKELRDSEVAEGVKFTFECEVDGEPMPRVQWFKDGILVENNPDYQTSMERGICKLTIEETFSEDTAKFVCKATNPLGVAETQSYLSVKESRPQNELIPPHFVQEPLDTVVSEREPLVMECQVFGNPLPLVSWFKDDVCIDYSTDYSITYNNGFCTLKIEETSPDHQGRYTCRAVNQVGQVACSANLKVTTSAPSERPCFIVPLSNVMARAGQKLRLECTISGEPQPQITWLHNSKSIKETRDTKFHFDGRNATLVITEAFPKDAGTYTIIARNKAGEAVSSCNVSVKGRLPLETSDSEIASDIEPAKPQVKQQLENQTVFEGNKVRMDCVIVGQPEPEVIWYHNGKPVKESDDFQLLFEGDRCTLIIKMAYLEDSGTYKCVAINSGGEASSVCQLKVEPVVETVQKSHVSQKDILLSIEKMDPPKFVKLLEGLAVTEGQPVVLECQLLGGPETTLSWYKDGLQIMNSPAYQIQTESCGLSKLTIPMAKISDRGTYSVKAQNKAGEAQSICTLSVSPETVPMKFRQISQETPPVFMQHIENQVLQPGATARFETIVEGSPKPTVRWNFQGKGVPKDEHYNVGTDGEKKYWLVIRDVSKNHTGRYSAIAENNAGIATTSAYLSVEEASLPEIDSAYEENIAQSMVMTRKTVVEKSTISSTIDHVDEMDFQPPTFPVFSSLQSQQLVKMEQTPIIEQPPSKPPKFTKPVSTAIVTEGEKLLLEAQYEGVPEPTIQWFKDEVEVKNRPGLQISSGSNRTSVFILKSFESDGGKYSCVAANAAGKATSIAEVRVKPYREAPKFKRKLQAAVVKSGSRVTLEAEVTGVPTPEIKWYRNGNPIENSPDFRISSSGNVHTLLISEVFPDDSGSYMIVASNVAGEARSLADLVVEEDKSPVEESYISMHQKREMFTKISINQTEAVQPFPTHPSVSKPLAEVKLPSTDVKLPPSPPPMPAVTSKVWTQDKPEPFPAPAITEAPEPEPIPSPEPIEEEKEVPLTITESNFVPPPDILKPTLSESFVKQSIEKFSKQDVKKQTETDQNKLAPKTQTQQPIVQNGIDVNFGPTSSFSKQSTFISESRSVSSTGFVSTPIASHFTPTKKFTPKPIAAPQTAQEKPQKSLVPIWSPQKEEKPKVPWRKVEPPSTVVDTLKTPIKPLQSVSEFSMLRKAEVTTGTEPFHSTTETKFMSTGTTASESKFSSTDAKSTSISTTSCQTSSTPTSFYTTESSTTTRTSYSTEEISITKKYEVVLEHKSETISSLDESSKSLPKPIIKKESGSEPRPKKEVVIEEEPVVGAEVKPPHFSKVRGAESLRKIYADN
ncbi:muscle M-line assembly protein unc-89-like isoform X2 [Stegodyphus dumicola]|uniref:muscle M-line assembly protein unc-89-like isoform X2 n=1 Tax=Stegodyphus dumicola TaxID=202533 RepID=UPI0015AC3AF8|nr:muscle M-line assembly protein unc-89-like isoform X2 [Stegodyphus dumicola]